MKVLVIDDDADRLEVYRLTLGMRWPDSDIVSSSSGDAGIQMVATEVPELVILDTDLTDMDGFRVCQRIRHFSDVPVIFVTAWVKESDLVYGLDSGADDYIIKPFWPLEFIARVLAVLRRTQGSSYDVAGKPFRCGDLVVDFSHKEVFHGEQLLNLTPTEYQLLSHLVKNAGKVVPYRTLLGRVWSREHLEDTNYLKVHIRHLREKLETDPTDPRYIVTARGFGYRFAKMVRLSPTPDRDNPPAIEAGVPITRMGEGVRGTFS